MADNTNRQRGPGSRNLPADIKAKWQMIGKYCQTRFNVIQAEQGLKAGIDYINSTYADKYSSGVNAPTDTMHQVDNGVNTPSDTINHADNGASEPPISMDFTEAEGKKKISALLPDSLHRRLSLHAAVTGISINQIIANLIHSYIPDYQVTVKQP